MHRTISSALQVTACIVAFSVADCAAAPARADQSLWNAVWITDTQTPDCGRIAALVDRLKAEKPTLIIHTGDARFEWVNQCAWKEVMSLMLAQDPPIELHLAPGNHDLNSGLLKEHLRRAASRGVYLVDTGQQAEGKGYYHNRVTADASGPEWPIWNPEVAVHSAWQPEANTRPEHHMHPDPPYRYVFKRGGIVFTLDPVKITPGAPVGIRDDFFREGVPDNIHRRGEIRHLYNVTVWP